MRYEVITDYEKYVQIIRHTGTNRDFVELDLSKYDLTEDRIYAYKLGKNELIWDEAKYKAILDAKQKIADELEITDLTHKLRDTDYIFAQWVEEVLALDNPLTWVSDIIKINIRYLKEYKETIANRKTWRERIKELES